MQQENTVEFLIQPIVTESESGRFAAAAAVLDRDGEERTIGSTAISGSLRRRSNLQSPGSIGDAVSDRYIRAG